MKQKTINKILVLAIVFLLAITLTLRFTEQDRVEHYICYDWYENGYGMNEKEVKEFCDKIIGED